MGSVGSASRWRLGQAGLRGLNIYVWFNNTSFKAFSLLVAFFTNWKGHLLEVILFDFYQEISLSVRSDTTNLPHLREEATFVLSSFLFLSRPLGKKETDPFCKLGNSCFSSPMHQCKLNGRYVCREFFSQLQLLQFVEDRWDRLVDHFPAVMPRREAWSFESGRCCWTLASCWLHKGRNFLF